MSAETIRKLQLRALLEAESALDRAKVSEDLLKYCRSELICRGLDSLKIEADGLSKALSSNPVVI